MICPTCEGTGIVPTRTAFQGKPWDGIDRRTRDRAVSNADLRFNEIEAAHYQSCPGCDGIGKLHETLLRSPSLR